jgi:hypothetical protein
MTDPTWTDPDIPDKDLRDKLRAYALEEVTWTDDQAPPDRFTSYTHSQTHSVGQRGEFGAKAFVAVQNVLDVLADYSHIGGARVSAEAVREAIRRGLS